jgi:serine/threonine protein kinase
MYCFKKDPELRWSAKQLLSHPWILKSPWKSIKVPSTVKTPVKETPKVEEKPKKIDLASKLAKFAQLDEKDDEEDPFAKMDEEDPFAKLDEEEKWGDSDDDDSSSQTIVKGSNIAKKLQKMNLGGKSKNDSVSSTDSDSKSDTIVKGNSIQKRILAMNAKPQESIITKEVKQNNAKASWMDDDDDGFSFAKGAKLKLKVKVKKEEDFDDDLMDQFQQESSGFDDQTLLKEVEAKQLYQILGVDSSDDQIRDSAKKLVKIKNSSNCED